MLEENKNIKDLRTSSSVSIKDTNLSSFYNKTNKLITALYMVTDIIDKDEPIRNKLRDLGVRIISDIHSESFLSVSDIDKKIIETVSLLDISGAINMISEMNYNILKKEFLQLRQSMVDSTVLSSPTWLQDFINTPSDTSSPDKGRNEEGFRPPLSYGHLPLGRGRGNSIGHINSNGHSTRIGVQKGSTLLQALSDKMSNRTNLAQFDNLKSKRREEISKIIKDTNGVGATITDIKSKAYGTLLSCSEKTLQRELFAMVHEGILKKTGEKRWSRYFTI